MFFSVSQGIALYPHRLGVSQNYVEGGGVRGVWGGGVSQLKPALCAIGRYRGCIAAILSQIAVGWPTKNMPDCITLLTST